ncbi:Tetratricopeptide repeat protein [compost metagenome]
MADAYRKLKKYEPAYEVLTTAIAADTGNLILQRARLPVAIQLKRYKEVILTGEKLLNDGLDPAVIRDVAMAFFHLKKYPDAIRYFQQLESIASQSESSLYYTSLSYRHLNNYKASAEYAKRTIEESISPNVSSYYLLLGGIYESSEQFLTAIGAYKKGLTFSPNASIYYRLGLIYDLKLNQKKTAISFYRQYLNSKLDKAAEKEQIDYVKSRLESLQPPKK